MSEASHDASVSTGDRLRQVAAELFAERGYAGASMTRIARRVGVRKPSLYNYCSSKEELFMDLLETSLVAWGEASSPALDEPGSCRERLHRHLRRTVDFAVDSPHAMALCRLAVAQVSGELGDRVKGHLLAQRVEYQRRIEAFFAEAVEAGEVVGEPHETLALGWLTFLDGVLTHHLFAIGERQSYFLDHLDDLWRLFWRGIAVRGEEEDV